MGLGVQETRGERELSLLSGTMMLEQLKEELQILETQYPNRFGYLKLELKSFIFLLETQNSSPNSFSLPTPSSVTTQASTTSKKRGDCDGYLNERRDRVDEVIERAQACLNKIQQFKTCFR